MSAYTGLAPFYDELTRDVDHGAFLRFYERIFPLYGKAPHTVLDLGCGTGKLTCLMAGRGYDMIGADASGEMLTEAIARAQSLREDRRPLFLLQGMEDLDLYGTVEAAVCCLDGMNYLPPEALRRALRRLRLFLEPGGVFVFDVNSVKKLRALDGEAFVDETDDVFCVWRAELDVDAGALRYGIDLFAADGDVWRREFEEHTEYLYDVETLKRILEEEGFGEIRVFGDRKLSLPEPDEDRIFVSARNMRRPEEALPAGSERSNG